ncbi:hypothetical protein Tco_0628456 [Tanacetum coccineum]|uniref:Uncharacterized protein n=1 Tax=Tanacetum coccineum TaxID=301880 RepID=A0ABQ4WQD3_9ASTR
MNTVEAISCSGDLRELRPFDRPTREVLDLAFRNRTSCGAAHFSYRLLTIMCRFLSVSSLAFGVEFRDILRWDSGCRVDSPWASQLRSYPLLTRAAAFKAWTVEIASSHYAPFRIPSEPGEMAPESLEAVVLPNLKGWKKKFFLLDRRAIPDAMPWRHGDTDLYDDLSANYNEDDVSRLSKVLLPLRPPPRYLLYMCGLTMACQNSELLYNIKDQDKNVINMYTFLKLPFWTGTVVSRGDPIPEDQRPKPRVTPPLPAGIKIPDLTPFQKNLEKPNSKIDAARERKEKQSLAKTEAKRGAARAAEEPRKKRKTQKHNEVAQSGSDETLSVNSLRQTRPAFRKKSNPDTDVVPGTSQAEKEVVDLSGNTRAPTPPATTAQPSPRHEHPNSQKHAAKVGHSYRYVPNWGLRNDLCVCTFRACRELVSHLATPAEDEFLGNLTNAEVVSRAYQTLGKSVLAQGGLLKRHEQLNHNYVEKIQGLEEKVGGLEREKLALSDEVVKAETDRKKLVREFIPTVIKRLHTSVEYRRSLAAPVGSCFTAGWLDGLSLGRTEEQIAQILSESRDLDIEGSKTWEAKHRELFTKSYPYVQKIADSYDFPMSELLKVVPDVPSTDKGTTSSPPKDASDTPFVTTT